jgi:hypothetical protein
MGCRIRTWGGVCSIALLITQANTKAAAQDVEPALGAPEAARFRVHVPNGEVAQAVKRALAGADRRLGDESCQAVLTDFHDPSARTLKEVLEANEVSARGYLRWINFSDGRGLTQCRPGGTMAVTQRGSRVVFICPAEFLKVAAGSPEEAEATVIHEMLHSLGLAENPPTSRQITERVRARCSGKPKTASAESTAAPR